MVELGEIPYQVSLHRQSDSRHICGGAILNSDWIVTAGQCVNEKRPSEMYAKTGSVNASSDGPSYDIQLAVLHPNYTREDAANNIALLRTLAPIIFNEFTKAIDISLDFVKPSELVTLSGWHADGAMSGSEILQSMSYRTISQEDCRQKLSADASNRPIYQSSFCAVTTIESGSCVGDIGSPLTAKELLIGLHLFNTGCGEEHPTVSLQVLGFNSWINTMMTSRYLHLPNSKCLCRSPINCICRLS